MIEPHVYLAYAPRGAGILCAVFWIVEARNVHGWFTGARGLEHPARYFVLEDYYSARETQCFISAGHDLYGDWMHATPEGASRVDRPIPVPPELCPELDRLQEAFATEWLSYEHDPAQPVPRLDIRASKLDKLRHEGPVFSYLSTGADIHVVGFLARRWPLDYQPD